MAEEQKKETTNNNAAVLIEFIHGEKGLKMETKVCDGVDPIANSTAHATAEVIKMIVMSHGAEEVK